MKEYKYKINGNDYTVKINANKEDSAEVEVNGKAYLVEKEKKVIEEKTVVKPAVTPPQNTSKKEEKPISVDSESPVNSKRTGIKTPLPGIIIDIKVNVGDTIKRGQTVAILEAMKMENNINSPKDGTVVAINVNKGDSVLESTDLIYIE